VLDIEETDFIEIDEDSKKVWLFIYFYFDYRFEGALLKSLTLTLLLWNDSATLFKVFL
jgi:hypothetical protein